MYKNCFFFSSRRRHTRWTGDWSSDVCSSDLPAYSRSEIHAYADPNLPWPHGAGGHQERIDERLSRRGRRCRAKGIEVDELAAKAEDRGVQHVIEFNLR